MTGLFKLSGFGLIIFTTCVLGFLKSESLNLRLKKLVAIKTAITDLKQRIRLTDTEIDKLISVSFKNVKNIYANLEKSDAEIVENFFNDIGMSDTEAEVNRCDLYISLLDDRITDAEKKYRELSKLYKSIGFWGGAFVCIFFM